MPRLILDVIKLGGYATGNAIIIEYWPYNVEPLRRSLPLWQTAGHT